MKSGFGVEQGGAGGKGDGSKGMVMARLQRVKQRYEAGNTNSRSWRGELRARRCIRGGV